MTEMRNKRKAVDGPFVLDGGEWSIYSSPAGPSSSSNSTRPTSASFSPRRPRKPTAATILDAKLNSIDTQLVRQAKTTANLQADKSEAARMVNIARIALEVAIGKASRAASALQALKEIMATTQGERKKVMALKQEREDLMRRIQELDNSITDEGAGA